MPCRAVPASQLLQRPDARAWDLITMCAAGEEAAARRPQSQTSLRVFFFFALKSRIVSRRPTALLSPFVSEPQSQSACKIDELVHGWVTMGDSQSEGRGGGGTGAEVCVSGDTAPLTQVYALAFSAHNGLFCRRKRSRSHYLRFTFRQKAKARS